jgi:hypothetical protein
MGSGAVIYVPSSMKIGSGIQKLIERIHTHTATWSHTPTLFFQSKESRLKKSNGHSSNCAATYNVELRQLSLFHGTISHVLRH